MTILRFSMKLITAVKWAIYNHATAVDMPIISVSSPAAIYNVLQAIRRHAFRFVTGVFVS
jgi:hypothetical protein